ncbi:hypothetical protein EVAR_61070_1 [Eumeta japonica]|uniref:Uncharacterized protein n=1 Tax=Eumeta variegata TaxID=151549 RepID=A0A4C1Z4Z5_EUMVA|nr:hypothetical protein EVAR_61070_1 [Eumeta japonica]
MCFNLLKPKRAIYPFAIPRSSRSTALGQRIEKVLNWAHNFIYLLEYGAGARRRARRRRVRARSAHQLAASAAAARRPPSRLMPIAAWDLLAGPRHEHVHKHRTRRRTELKRENKRQAGGACVHDVRANGGTKSEHALHSVETCNGRSSAE